MPSDTEGIQDIVSPSKLGAGDETSQSEAADNFDFRPASQFDVFEYDSPQHKDYSSSPSPPPSSVCSDDLVAFFETPCRTLGVPVKPDSLDLISKVCDHIGEFIVAQAERNRDVITSSPFDAPTECSVTLPFYLDRIMKYSHVMPETFVCATALVRRIVATKGLVITSRNCLRLMAAAIRICAKFYDDELDDRKFWKQIAGLHRYEVNNLEAEILNLCDFQLRIAPEEFHDVVVMVSAFERTILEHHDPFRKSLQHSDTTSSVDSNFNGSSHSPVMRPRSIHRTNSETETEASSGIRQPNHPQHRRFVVPFFHKIQARRQHKHVQRFSAEPRSPFDPPQAMAKRRKSVGFFIRPTLRPSVSVENHRNPKDTPPQLALPRPVKPSHLPRTLSLQHITEAIHGIRIFHHHTPHHHGSTVPAPPA